MIKKLQKVFASVMALLVFAGTGGGFFQLLKAEAAVQTTDVYINKVKFDNNSRIKKTDDEDNVIKDADGNDLYETPWGKEKDKGTTPKATVDDKSQITGSYINDGTEDIDGLKDLARVENAEFTVYDVTSIFKKLTTTSVEAERLTPKAALEAIAKAGKPVGISPLKTAKTNSEGKAKFTLDNTEADGEGKVYLFLETGSPSSINHIAQPVALMLPQYDKDGVAKVFNVFPKDVDVAKPDKYIEKQQLDLDKDGVLTSPGGANAVEGTFNVGDPIKYHTEFTLPAQIGATTNDGTTPVFGKYEIYDVPQKELTFIGLGNPSLDYWNGSAWVPFDVDEGVDYTVTTNYTEGLTGTDGTQYDGKGFKLSFKMDRVATRDSLAAVAGKRIRLNYTMKLNELAVPDISYRNATYIKAEHNFSDGSHVIEYPSNPNNPTTPHSPINPPIESQPVRTGGYKFVKVDKVNHDTKLQGAEFHVKRLKEGSTTEYEYAQFKDNTGATITNVQNVTTAASIIWGARANASVIKSGSDGTFAIKGLDYGDYVLQETKAPEGYAKEQADRPFTVKKGTYYYTVALNLTDMMVENTKSLLPETGGKGIIAFLIVGSILMIGAALWYRRSNKEVSV